LRSGTLTDQPDNQAECRQSAKRAGPEPCRQPPAGRLASSESTHSGKTLLTLGGAFSSKASKAEASGGFSARAGADRSTIRAQLREVPVAIAKPPQDGQEEERLAEHPPAGDPQRISEPAVMMLIASTASSSASVCGSTVRRET
jgi:hypothetical protein